MRNNSIKGLLKPRSFHEIRLTQAKKRLEKLGLTALDLGKCLQKGGLFTNHLKNSKWQHLIPLKEQTIHKITESTSGKLLKRSINAKLLRISTENLFLLTSRKDRTLMCGNSILGASTMSRL